MTHYGVYEIVQRTSDSYEENDSSWFESDKENLLFTGDDRAKLIEDTNTYFAHPDRVNSYRGIVHHIDPETGCSANRYSQGGGCGINRRLVVKALPGAPKC